MARPHRQWREWKAAEIDVLRARYTGGNLAEMPDLLPGRSSEAIRHKAQRLSILSLRREWTGAEQERLRKLWPEASRRALVRAFPGRSWETIKRRASWLGLRRKKLYLAESYPAWTLGREIVSRLAQMKITRPELAEILGRRLQRPPKWLRPDATATQVAFASIERLVAALGGEIVIKWQPVEEGELPRYSA
jgi:hypothetical protein